LNELLRPFEFPALMPMQIIKCQNLVGELLGSIYLHFWHITTFFPTIIIMPRPNNGGGGGRSMSLMTQLLH
jgi:hypothetical protein